MRRILLVAGVVVLLLAIVIASVYRAQKRQSGEKVYAEPVTVRSITQAVKASGQVDPRVKVNLSAHVIGKIERLYVAEGDEVAAGQPFLDLEKDAFLAARDRAAAQVEIARTQLRQAEIDQADAELKRRRAEKLAAESILSTEAREAAELAEDSARLRTERAREELQQARAELQKAQDDLDKTTLYAPLAGRVIALNAEAGEVVVSGTMNNPASVIGTIADLSEILVEVEVDETEIVEVDLGQEATIEVDALPNVEYRGRVVEIGSSGFARPNQPDVTYFKVKILFGQPDERLRPGMSARAEVEVATHAEALVVPIQAVVYRRPLAADAERPPITTNGDDEEVQVVFVVEDGKAMQRAVTLGLSDTTHVELATGVVAGELVVTGPYRTLRDLEHGKDVVVEDEKDKDKSHNGDADDGEAESTE